MPRNESNCWVERWHQGVPLSEAWLNFGDPFAVTKLRETETRGAFDAQRILMVADLWAGLRCNDFEAFGKCVAPVISNGPIQIPTHTFEFRPPYEMCIGDDFEISGWRYESIKVCRAGAALDYPAPDVQPEESDQSQVIVRTSKRGGGARNRYPDVRAVLIQMFEASPAYRIGVAANLLKPFNEKYLKIYSNAEIQRAPISERSLREHLKTFRQDLAKIGKD